MATRPRNRSRERAGKSESSWIKQALVRRVARSQAFAYRYVNPSHRLVLIDGNAGDGVGISVPQADLFEGEINSRPTPQILTELAGELGAADVILCERDKDRRESLKARFPRAIILPDHKHASAHIRAEHCYALWVSDPCGPKDHGIATMRALADNPRIRTDFIVILNEGFIDSRLRGTSDILWATSRERYLRMIDPLWWAGELRKTSVAYSRRIAQSPAFHFRLLILTNHPADVARRKEFTIARAKPRLAGE